MFNHYAPSAMLSKCKHVNQFVNSNWSLLVNYVNKLLRKKWINSFQKYSLQMLLGDLYVVESTKGKFVSRLGVLNRAQYGGSELRGHLHSILFLLVPLPPPTTPPVF